MQCGSFGSDPFSVAVLTKCSVAVLVVAVLVAKSFVAILGVAVLECGRFDQDPMGLGVQHIYYFVLHTDTGSWGYFGV